MPKSRSPAGRRLGVVVRAGREADERHFPLSWIGNNRRLLAIQVAESCGLEYWSDVVRISHASYLVGYPIRAVGSFRETGR